MKGGLIKRDRWAFYPKYTEFTVPLKTYLEADHSKAKDLCIDCGMPMNTKEKVSIAFMQEMADDLSRKKSAFWDCKVDAFLCPSCAFIYALSPLGFQLIGSQFVFINRNESITGMLSSNSKDGKMALKAEKEEQEKYSFWFARTINIILSEKIKELSNLQIIIRGKDSNDKYHFSIIHKEILKMLKQEQLKRHLIKLAEYPFVKIGNQYLNVYEKSIMNILDYQNQYILLNQLLKASIENEGVMFSAYYVYQIQLWMNIVRAGIKREGEKVIMSRLAMRDSGYALRKSILSSKGVTTDECLRGTIYQLLNALSVRNEEKFLEIVIRMYCSSKFPMPDGFIWMVGDSEKFQEYGYAFVLGLKGSYTEKKKEGVVNE